MEKKVEEMSLEELQQLGWNVHKQLVSAQTNYQIIDNLITKKLQEKKEPEKPQ